MRYSLVPWLRLGTVDGGRASREMIGRLCLVMGVPCQRQGTRECTLWEVDGGG